MNKVNDVEDPFKELNESLNELQTKDWSVLPESMTVQDIAEVDDQMITMAPFLTNELILEEVSAIDKKDENNDFANDSDDDEEVKKLPVQTKWGIPWKYWKTVFFSVKTEDVILFLILKTG